MMRKRLILPPAFFDRPTLRVARELLGKYLVRRVGSRNIALPITEVEAYVGPEDRASHASRFWRGSPRAARGRTLRNGVMFEGAGTWYVYFTYGMHWMANIVTERRGYPAAILIRGVAGISGPARVAKHFGIDRRFNGRSAFRRTGLWIEDRGLRVSPRAGTRIGVGYAGAWRNKPWRFFCSL